MFSATEVSLHSDDGAGPKRTYDPPAFARSLLGRGPLSSIGADLLPSRVIDIATRRSLLRVERLASDACDVSLTFPAHTSFRLLLPARRQGAGVSSAPMLLAPERGVAIALGAPLELVMVTFDAIALEDVVASGGSQLDLEAIEAPEDAAIGQDAILGSLALAINLGLPAAASEAFFTQLVLAAVLRTVTVCGAAMANPRLGGLAPWQERRGKQLISEDLGKARSVGDIAKACNLSLTHFSRAFKISTGATPHEWLQSERITQAGRLLKTGMSLVEVAAACGFADQSHFSKIFKRQNGVSPGVWRRLNAKPTLALGPSGGAYHGLPGHGFVGRGGSPWPTPPQLA